ncbi:MULTISPECIES: sensor domain-containing diguanylate cyclase [Psychrilyobacter]|uniref:Diguanylate cyclase n=1 Tax=Psychrilyobacter piezotolerans TaxID=2293438 RepID=A0ABX9KHS4_9FUSO|nr:MULTISPECIES: GGDEF domain-containing protein [Psychrilyobacter]MCS5421821.1 GGDEF domain-containing protein [Psychrilyobacter sp. S5]NDI77581.1 GGDEF domain-containing protein [Psychrilyobacter piezotolerans]RDE62911.1 GGDEF domain-containing protein [Psychrilyobacter sp. S5]REI41669.1 diguanylate cyclase [Psychrilyobacter piezotolerans]
MSLKKKMVNNGPHTEEACKLMREKNILYFIREITKALLSTSSIEEMSKMVYTFLKDSYGECTIGLAVNYPKEKKISDCFFFEEDKRLDFEEILYSEGSSSKLLKAVLNKKEYIYEKKRKKTSVFIGRIPSTSFFAPLIIEKDVIGAFTFQIYERDIFSIEEIEVCRELIPFMTIALNNSLQNKKILLANKILEKYSKYDDLTGIYNRRFFYESFDKIYRRSILEDEKVFLFLMDLNNFKGVNDNFGHFVGDEVLIEVAEVLKKLFFNRGEVGRYGGDEFLCGIAKVSKKTVIELAEKIIDKIDNLDIHYNNSGGKVGISIGILELNSKKDLRDYFLQLDENLYKAKNSTTKKIFIS